MGTKVSLVSKPVIESTIDELALASNSSPIIKDIARPKSAVFIETLKVKPEQLRRIPLGKFTDEIPPKGFLIELDSDPDLSETVVTKVITLGPPENYKLFLDVANYGDKAVNAGVWQL